MNALSKEMKFFIFLLEQYAAHQGATADKVLKQWNDLQLTDHINKMYEQYHTEAIENAFEDIDRMIAERQNLTLGTS